MVVVVLCCAQGTASAPLWDTTTRSIPGVISASDFITILRRLRHSVSAGANPLSEAEMDAHTIRGLREEAAAEGREPKGLVYVLADEDLAKVGGEGGRGGRALMMEGWRGRREAGAQRVHVLKGRRWGCWVGLGRRLGAGSWHRGVGRV